MSRANDERRMGKGGRRGKANVRLVIFRSAERTEFEGVQNSPPPGFGHLRRILAIFDFSSGNCAINLAIFDRLDAEKHDFLLAIFDRC
jgi:hypothetical protein